MDTEHALGAPLRVALIGCGKMGLNHVKAIQACGLASLVAVADPGGDREKMQALLPAGVTWFTSAAEMLQTARPDVVHIVTPPSSHAELASLCMQHGANIYVEKPFTLESSEAQAILEQAAGSGKSVCAGHQLLFEGPARTLIANLPVIGRVVHVESYFAFRPVRKSRDGRSFMTPIDQLLDILPHPVYTLLDVLSSTAAGATPSLEALQVGPDGEVHALLRAGEATGVLVVTLRGRPVDSYLRVVGTNGSLRADFVRGCVTRLPGAGTSAIAVLTNPYREATQIVVGSTKGFGARILGKKKGYPGLNELIDAFYRSIRGGGAQPLSPASILTTVKMCEQVGDALRASDEARETQAARDLGVRERTLPATVPGRGVVLVTGATGLLGRPVVARLRAEGWRVTALSRNIPPPSAREAGVDYASADLSEPLDRALFHSVTTVVHCAAETAGGKEAHDRNTVLATRNVLEAAAANGVKNFLHISSIAVLKPSSVVGAPLTEQTPVDVGNLGRGPYVWAKAESERYVVDNGAKLGLTVRVIRPGPLVDFDAYTPPGRLGRELGPVFLAIGPRKGRLSLCAVRTAAQVIAAGVADFAQMPPILNLVEPIAPTRAELMSLWLQKRPDLSTFWLPGWVLSGLSPLAKLAQRILRPRATPIDVAAAFASEQYDASLAETVIRRAQSPAKAPMLV